MRRAVVVSCILAVLLGACSHGHRSTPGSATPPTSTQSSSAARSTRLLTIGKVDVESAGRTARVSKATQRAVLATAQRYVDSALLAPLETGKLGRDYPQVFASSIRPAATGPDRGRLTDLGIGKATSFSESSTPVALSALVDQSGALLYVATNFRVSVNAIRPAGAIAVSRTVELTLQPDPKKWVVVAYRITVKRTAPVTKATTPTTRRSPERTTTTAPRGKKKAP